MTWNTSVVIDGNCCHITVEGRVDGAVADEFHDAVRAAVTGTAARTVVLDLSRTSRLGAVAAAGLLVVAVTARRDGREFVVGGCDPRVRRMLTTVGVVEPGAGPAGKAGRIANSSLFRAFAVAGNGRARRAVLAPAA